MPFFCIWNSLDCIRFQINSSLNETKINSTSFCICIFFTFISVDCAARENILWCEQRSAFSIVKENRWTVKTKFECAQFVSHKHVGKYKAYKYAEKLFGFVRQRRKMEGRNQINPSFFEWTEKKYIHHSTLFSFKTLYISNDARNEGNKNWKIENENLPGFLNQKCFDIYKADA